MDRSRLDAGGVYCSDASLGYDVLRLKSSMRRKDPAPLSTIAVCDPRLHSGYCSRFLYSRIVVLTRSSLVNN